MRRGNDQVILSGKFFFLVIGAICAGLCLSALLSFYTLSGLRIEYLNSRGRDIAGSIDSQMHGPGLRSDITRWQSILEETLKSFPETIAFIEVEEEPGQRWAGAGEETDASDLFIYQSEILFPRGPRWAEGRGPSSAVLRIGLYRNQARFIIDQAYIHLCTAALAIVALIFLSVYLWKTLHRFLELKLREESKRHLATLGEMSATLAHEIRNPLGSMKGLTQIVKESLPADHTAQSLMDTVVTEAERLEQLVSDLLAFARPSAGNLSLVSLNQLCREVLEILKLPAKEKDVKILFHEIDRDTIMTDKDGLHQVLLNVLLNAIEASPVQGTVTLGLSVQDRLRRVTIQIQDEGTGFGDLDPDEFFQPFKTTKVRGSGLGLAISRRIVERLRGRITLANREDGRGGSCLIWLPLKEAGPEIGSRRPGQSRRAELEEVQLHS